MEGHWEEEKGLYPDWSLSETAACMCVWVELLFVSFVFWNQGRGDKDENEEIREEGIEEILPLACSPTVTTAGGVAAGELALFHTGAICPLWVPVSWELLGEDKRVCWSVCFCVRTAVVSDVQAALLSVLALVHPLC